MTDISKTVAELREAYAKTTPGPLTMNRYDHGGGRAFVQKDDERELVADLYNEGDREFFYAIWTALPTLLNELERVQAHNKAWYEAAMLHYPQEWACDPGNTRLTISNIVEHARASALAERDALAARLDNMKAIARSALDAIRGGEHGAEPEPTCTRCGHVLLKTGADSFGCPGCNTMDIKPGSIQ